MPRRAVLTTLAVMWLAIGASAALVGFGEPSRPTLAAVIVALGLVGTLFVLRLQRRPQSETPDLLGDGEGESPVVAD
jgi:hypothetical protein